MPHAYEYLCYKRKTLPVDHHIEIDEFTIKKAAYQQGWDILQLRSTLESWRDFPHRIETRNKKKYYIFSKVAL